MSRLLHVEASPRKERSSSLHVARAFLDAYREAHPAESVETLDLWSIELPEFDGDTIDAKYRILHGQQHTPAEAEAWRAVVAVFERFARADKYLFSVPMWNFGIPYKLKQFIDVIAQPGLSFTVEPGKGYRGLVVDRPAVVIYSRGGGYGDDSGAGEGDFQKSYFDMFLRFIGFRAIENVVVEPTQASPERADAARTKASARAVELAASRLSSSPPEPTSSSATRVGSSARVRHPGDPQGPADA